MKLLCILLTVILFMFKLLNLVNISWLMVFMQIILMLIFIFIIIVLVTITEINIKNKF